MKHLKDILEGYCDPKQKQYAVNAIGETGLTPRIHWLCYLGTAVESLIRPKFCAFGGRHFYDTYWPIVHTYRESYVTEFLRIMDKPRTGKRENLTVCLLHERFQADQSIPLGHRQTEQSRFDDLNTAFTTHRLWEFRCAHQFHIDLSRSMQQPAHTGASIHDLTKLILAWYSCVGSYVFGGEPKYVTVGAVDDGRRFAKQIRRMMVADLRNRRSKATTH